MKENYHYPSSGQYSGDSSEIPLNQLFFESLISDRSAKACVSGSTIMRMQYRGGRSKRLLVLFHPAQPPNSSNRPYFMPFLPLDVPQLSISDPTLEGHAELAAGWYLGRSNEGLPEKINHFVNDFSRFLGCSHRIYLGGSSGGFAALLYSAMDPNSIAISACPQVDLDSYNNSTVLKWKLTCYPDSESNATIKSLTCIDLIHHYSKDFKNSVVILVSAGDYGHLFGQIAPLLSAVHPAKRSQIALDARYYGIQGHSGSVPPQAYLPWVKAAFAAKTLLASDVMEAHHLISEREPSRLKTNERPDARNSGLSEHDVRMAELLRNYHLNLSQEN